MKAKLGVPLVPSPRFKVSITGARMRPSGIKHPAAWTRFFLLMINSTFQDKLPFKQLLSSLFRGFWLLVKLMVSLLPTPKFLNIQPERSAHKRSTHFLEVLRTIQELENDDNAKRIWLSSVMNEKNVKNLSARKQMIS